MLISRAVLLMSAIGILAVLPVRADPLVGTQVSDSVVLTYGTTITIPIAGVTTTIGNGITDLTSSYSGLNTITVEFNVPLVGVDTLTIIDTASLGAPLLAGSVTLVDPAFQNFNLTLQSGGTLPGINLTQNGDTMVFTWSGGPATLASAQTFSATYVDPPPVDEPSSSGWLGVGLGALALALLGRKSAIHQA